MQVENKGGEGKGKYYLGEMCIVESLTPVDEGKKILEKPTRRQTQCPTSLVASKFARVFFIPIALVRSLSWRFVVSRSSTIPAAGISVSVSAIPRSYRLHVAATSTTRSVAVTIASTTVATISTVSIII